MEILKIISVNAESVTMKVKQKSSPVDIQCVKFV